MLLGLVCATERWGWQLPLAAGIATVFMVVILGLPFTESGWAAMRRLYRWGAVIGVGSVAASGLVAVGGVAGASLVLMVAASSPDLRAELCSRWPSWFGAPPAAQPAPTVGSRPRLLLPELPGLDVEGLCLAWRQSFVALEATPAGPAHLDVVRWRAAVLDELQRRCPEGFGAWIASGARAAGNPLPYLDGSSSARRPWTGPPGGDQDMRRG